MSTSISRCSRNRFRAARGNSPTPPMATAIAYPNTDSRPAVTLSRPIAGPSQENAIPSASASPEPTVRTHCSYRDHHEGPDPSGSPCTVACIPVRSTISRASPTGSTAPAW